MTAAIERLIANLGAAGPAPVYLVAGDRVLAEPAAMRLGQAIGERVEASLEVHRRPERLDALLADLRTFSLFAAAKVVVAVETSVLADRSAAAELIDDAAEALPVDPSCPGGDASARVRQAAARLLQVLHLFGVDPRGAATEAVLGELPAWVFQGGRSLRRARRSRGKRQQEELRRNLGALLEVARQAGLEGRGAGDLADLGDAVREGLPPGHVLILAESAVAEDHPLVQALARRGTVARVGEVAMERGGGWAGAELLAGELERETGVAIDAEAAAELARRTLRQQDRGHGVDADSTSRFAAEYRKLATLAPGGIDRGLVAATVEDRGQEDVWQILDALGSGSPTAATGRLQRLLAAADDPLGARLAFFGLLASFCRHLTAIAGLLSLSGAPRGVASYPRFKQEVAPALQEPLPDGGANPVSGLHPFRLHRAYLAACRLPVRLTAALPWLLLETELRLKGESGEPDAALVELFARFRRN